jgi:excisionase family DNA binding protein
MSLDNINEKPKRQRRRRERLPVERIAYTVAEWAQATRQSKPTIYRQMQRGQLRYVQFGRVRRIPVSEQDRLGLGTTSTTP